MAGIEAPSFSLGLDLDLDSESQRPDPSSPTRDTSAVLEDPERFQLSVSDSDLDAPNNPSPTLRRLRRGLSTKPKSITYQHRDSPLDVDDDIEEFSSQELGRPDEHQSVQQHSVCGSSKVSLHGCGVLTRKATETLGEKCKEIPCNPSDKIRDKHAYSELTVSPVRRFRLLDSDSDDPSECVDIDRDASSIHFSKKTESSHGCSVPACENKSEPSTRVPQTVDLWNDFCPEKTFHVPTPALDEFCEEYFRAAKDTNAAPQSVHGLCSSKREQRNEGNKRMKHTDTGCALPPAHRYFFHDNLRIQRLVRSRLPHFWPLASMGGEGYEQPDASVIDYMGQFGESNGPKQQHSVKSNDKKTSRRTRKDRKNSNVEEMSLSSGNWVDPRHQANIPKDAGKRRIHADGQSSGQWYTAENGRKVYVTRNGQELTGQMAYRQYRKESGAGFRKSKKKKANTKKK